MHGSIKFLVQEVAEADFGDASLNYQITVGFFGSFMKVQNKS